MRPLPCCLGEIAVNGTFAYSLLLPEKLAEREGSNTVRYEHLDEESNGNIRQEPAKPDESIPAHESLEPRLAEEVMDPTAPNV